MPLAFEGRGHIEVDAGNTLLAWHSHGPVRLEMAPESQPEQVRVVYSGAAHSYFLSGLADGSYRLQLRAEDGGTSDALTISVRHQSLSRALWLVAVGAFVTLLVVGTILRGVRDE